MFIKKDLSFYRKEVKKIIDNFFNCLTKLGDRFEEDYSELFDGFQQTLPKDRVKNVKGKISELPKLKNQKTGFIGVTLLC